MPLDQDQLQFLLTQLEISGQKTRRKVFISIILATLLLAPVSIFNIFNFLEHASGALLIAIAFPLALLIFMIAIFTKGLRENNINELKDFLTKRPGDVVWIYKSNIQSASIFALLNKKQNELISIVTRFGVRYNLTMKGLDSDKVFELLDQHCENAYMGWAYKIIPATALKPDFEDAAKKIVQRKEEEGTKGSYRVHEP